MTARRGKSPSGADSRAKNANDVDAFQKSGTVSNRFDNVTASFSVFDNVRRLGDSSGG